MTIHHTKHHQTYVTNLNAAYEKMLDAQAKGNIDAVIALQGAIKFNGGGHVNHSIFWQNLCPVSYVGSTQIPDESDRQLLPGSLITPSHVYTSGKAVVCFNKAR